MAQRVRITDGVQARLGQIGTRLMSRVRPSVRLSPRAPELKSLSVPQPFGDPAVGAELMEGRWRYGGQAIDVGSHGHPFSTSLPSERFASWVHSFDWLADLLSVPGGASKAGQLAVQWVEAFPGGSPFVFAPDLLARRSLEWGAMLHSIEDGRSAVRSRYAGQLKLLKRTLAQVTPGLPILRAQAALVIYGARLNEKSEATLSKALDGLDDEIALQILADGGHVSRAPSAAVEALHILQKTDRVLQAANLQGSKSLDRAIDRLLPMITTLRHTDGEMALFHGGQADSAKRIDALMKYRPGEPPQAFAFSPHSGYHRLQAGGSVVLIDTGAVPPRPYDLDAHLAPLAVEISTIEGRLLTNCGWHDGASPAWRRPVRSSAAHSTLTVNERSPGEFLDEGFLADTLGPAVAVDPDTVRARRKEHSQGIWLETSHDGYKPDHGLVHRRRLFVGETGDDIRGEDSLFVPAGDVPITRDSTPFALRFHFHPDVRVSLAQDLSSALLVQKGIAGWRFRTDGGPLAVEPSVYLGDNAKPVRCQQLVISGSALGDGDGQGKDNRVRWSFRRLKGRES